ncbi:MAG TPA: hypothetical protein VGP72_05285 [Planctomycetota bacterium]|jgi:hypothetical protein
MSNTAVATPKSQVENEAALVIQKLLAENAALKAQVAASKPKLPVITLQDATAAALKLGAKLQPAKHKAADGSELPGFKSGSRGFQAWGKVQIGEARYQVQIQAVEIGSKPGEAAE